MSSELDKARKTIFKAIEMHQMHIDRPTTATMISQKSLMALMKEVKTLLDQYSKVMKSGHMEPQKSMKDAMDEVMEKRKY